MTTAATTIKEFRPEFGEPGSQVTFEEHRDHQTVTRTGIVWARGPVPSSVWVQPDDDPANQVAVKLPTKRARDRRKPEAMPEYPASWQRDVIRRCDNVRRFGCVFGVIDSVGHGGITTVSRHVDPDCPSAAGKEAYEFSGPTVREVVDVLLGRYQFRSTARLCLRCIYLDETAEIGAAA